MPDDFSVKPKKLSEHPDYFVVYDSQIPIRSKENIILKPSGMEIIAKHYFQKYGVIILVCPEFLKIDQLAEKIQDYLLMAKKAYSHFKTLGASQGEAMKVGFIFISNDDPDDIYGHALPMIWEKTNQEEHLFFLDTTQYLGETVAHKLEDGVQAFRKKLLSLIPGLKLWSVFGCRQIDYSSCYTDALVTLRDGLRVPVFKLLCDAKVKEIVKNDLIVFHAPDCLLRTAQVASYPEKSHADLHAVIRMRCKGNEEKSETLVQFRNRFDVPVEVNAIPKKFGTFTLFKARQYVAYVEHRALAKQMVAGVFQKLFL
jgi:hypothetical protein